MTDRSDRRYVYINISIDISVPYEWMGRSADRWIDRQIDRKRKS